MGPDYSVGITLGLIADGAYGSVAKIGNVPGIITAAGLTPAFGAKIYISDTPGEITDIAPANPIILGVAEPAEGPIPSGVAEDLYLSPVLS